MTSTLDSRTVRWEISVSVVIPTHNPRPDYFNEVLGALRGQTLDRLRWELIVIDNDSTVPLSGRISVDWHPYGRIVREDKLGLTYARIAGFENARGNVITLVDDDNVLSPNYLEQVLGISGRLPDVGVWSGAVVPRYENGVIELPESLHSLLTLRRVSTDFWSNDPSHHMSTPWGAGLCVRRDVAHRYVAELNANPARYGLDLKGKTLLYGGDTDIAYTACRMGYGKGVFSALSLVHLIPSNRCTMQYLARVAYGRGYSEVLHHTSLTGAFPRRYEGAAQVCQKWLRRWKMSPLERAVDKAAELGRRSAFRELCSGA